MFYFLLSEIYSLCGEAAVGPEGFEPSPAKLKFGVLPLHHDPLATGGRCVSGDLHAAYFNSSDALIVECRTIPNSG